MLRLKWMGSGFGCVAAAMIGLLLSGGFAQPRVLEDAGFILGTQSPPQPKGKCVDFCAAADVGTGCYPLNPPVNCENNTGMVCGEERKDKAVREGCTLATDGTLNPPCNNTTQKYCYQKRNCICYYNKTQMIWGCAADPDDTWRDAPTGLVWVDARCKN